MLDDDIQLGEFICRSLDRYTSGSLSLQYCETSEAFRAHILSRVGGALPLLMVTSDCIHPGSVGFEDLAFVQQAPDDLACGGIRIRATHPVMITAHGNEEVAAEARAKGLTFIEKPVRMEDVTALVTESVHQLMARIERDLVDAPNEAFLKGEVTWGPVEVVRATLERLHAYAPVSRLRSRPSGRPR